MEEKEKEKEKIINYSIKYHKLLKEYILWKELTSEKGFNVIGIYKGTKQQCKDKLKEIKTSSK